MPSSRAPSSKAKPLAAPCPQLPRPVDVHAARGLQRTTFDGVMVITSNAPDTLAWCMSVHLVPSSLLCPKCTHAMRLDVTHERWRCSRAACRTERSVRTGSFFAKNKLPLRKLVRLLLHWCARTAVTSAAHMVGVNEQAAMQWYTYCRDICSKETLSIPMELFGGVDRTTNRWFGIVTYEDRTKPTLSALIKKHIKAGTTIISDQFASYVSVIGKHTLANNRLLRDKNYKHLWVNHSETYVDPAMRGMKKTLLPMYLNEYLWRSSFTPPQATPTDLLRSLVTGIVKYYY
ncbi:hypothetical protein PHYSODRAFT_262161 [Phytophthora sojae]|uniref:ISXO2-like transposase domain-containing protein n=1 Tax=Phytophthora sojae (strain P6497) TaxID=1094619 RepID=G5A2V5_PHYSP|nr:hypothetical protein PHYSODRAFT_262161 [Phytophthora sojae]EGZ09995.1 hypothetical protein PHYSODRAFT_262161 [Phytophthora sojae]|eukprot:XP_009534856.1 hypothetical protein PHYSODRAFT_262161 [Phytophthora sojae]